jgi:hypothetical protein
MGCHASQADADSQLAALYANEPAAGVAVSDVEELGLTSDSAWEGVLLVEGVTTGDGREFVQGGTTWAEPPLPVSWQKYSSEGHAGSVIVGRIDNIWRDEANPAVIRGNGVLDLNNPDGVEVQRQMREQFLRGNSVDVDSVKDADVEAVFPEAPVGESELAAEDSGSGNDSLMDLFGPPPEKMIFHAGRIRGTTLVSLPAFVEAQVWLANMPPATPMPMMPDVAQSPRGSGTGDNMMATGDVATSPTSSGEGETEVTVVASGVWDGTVAERRLAPRLALTLAREAFGHVGGVPKSGTVHRSDCSFLHHEINADGTPLRPNVNACLAAIGNLLTDATLSMSLSERHTAYAHMARHVRDAGLVPQPFTSETMSMNVRALTAGAKLNIEPPAEWFTDQHLTRPTALTITASGHIYGHAALFGTCHTSVQDACVQPPYEVRHDYFMLGEVITAGGNESVATGCITLGTGHAPTFGVTAQQAIEHYDNTGTRVADVVTGNDSFGIWFSGTVRSDIAPARLAELRAAKLSGDWRRIGGQLRLVAMLAVNVPGFPVPRLSTRINRGQQLALVASGVITDADVDLLGEVQRMNVEMQKIRVVMAQMKLSLGRRIGRGPEIRRAELRSRVHKEM